MTRKQPESELVRAAFALEEELGRFEAAAEEAREPRFHSKRNLEQGAQVLLRAADVESRLGICVGALVAAIRAANQRQQVATAVLRSFGEELQQRQAVYRALTAEYEAFALAAAELRVMLSDRPDALAEARALLVALVARVEGVASNAQAQGFRDVALDAGGRREQLVAALSKLERAGAGLD